MSMEYIRQAYAVPAKRGYRVTVIDSMGRKHGGVITGASVSGNYLRVRLDGVKYSQNYHPKSGVVEYLRKSEP